MLDSEDFTTLITWGIIQVPQVNIQIALSDIWYDNMIQKIEKAKYNSIINTDE